MQEIQTLPEAVYKPEAGALLAPATCSAALHFSSETNEWATPQEFFDRINALHNFTLDPCCTHQNAKCIKHYTMTENGLAQSWQNERVWMNPPYGREIGAWMKKAYDESRGSALVVCLVPSRTDTAWWHNYAVHGEITFVKGRLKFGGHKNSAPFPSAVITLKPQNVTELSHSPVSRGSQKREKSMNPENNNNETAQGCCAPVSLLCRPKNK